MTTLSSMQIDDQGGGTEQGPNLVNRLHESRSPYVSSQLAVACNHHAHSLSGQRSYA